MSGSDDGSPAVYLFTFLKVVWFILASYAQAIYHAVVPYSMQFKKSLKGKVVVLTGAGGGIGKQVALKLVDEGCRLVLWDVNSELNSATVQACKAKGADVYGQLVDVTDRKAVYTAAEDVRRNFGSVDILINNAGLLNINSNNPFVSIPDEKIEKLYQVNLIAHAWTVKAFLPRMLEKGEGHIVSVASAASIIPVANLVEYCASKYGALGFMESLCCQLQLRGQDFVKCTTFCPYYVKTPMIAGLPRASKLDFDLLEPDDTANRLIRAIRTNERMVLYPAALNFLYCIRNLFPYNMIQSVLHHDYLSYY